MRARLGVASILVLVLGACGESKGTSGAPGAPAEPAVYLRGVCGALVQWHDDTGAALEADSGDSKDPAIIRRELLKALDGVQRATDALRTSVNTAGTPKVSGGERLARPLRDSLGAMSRELKANRDSFAAIRVNDVDMGAIKNAYAGMVQQLDVVTGAVQPLDQSPELHQAYEGDPACVKFKHYAP